MDSILEVEDEKSVRDALKDALEHFGYKVMVAGNGEEGLKYFNSHCFNIVITDIQMPIMNGFELARSISNSDNLKTPIMRSQHILKI